VGGRMGKTESVTAGRGQEARHDCISQGQCPLRLCMCTTPLEYRNMINCLPLTVCACVCPCRRPSSMCSRVSTRAAWPRSSLGPRGSLRKATHERRTRSRNGWSLLSGSRHPSRPLCIIDT
jgi:hypothetical protein